MSKARRSLFRISGRPLLRRLCRGFQRVLFAVVIGLGVLWLVSAYWHEHLTSSVQRTAQGIAFNLVGTSGKDRPFLLNRGSFHTTDARNDADIYRCIGGTKHWPVEDIFCLPKPRFEPGLKNPCWYEKTDNGGRQLQCLPYFHVLGVDKAGSTDLFHRLIQHPQILQNSGYIGKEVYFWCWLRYGRWYFERKIADMKNLSYYISAFSGPATEIDRAHQSNAKPLITGDGTPMTFWEMTSWQLIPQNFGRASPVVTTPHLMKHLYPSTPKFVVILRNPAERLYSDYYFTGSGDSPDSFHDHVAQAIAILRRCFSELSPRLCLFNYETQMQLPLRLTIGCYSVYLREWLSVFPRETFFVLRMEVYSKTIESSLQRLFSFLGLDPAADDQLKQWSEIPTVYETQGKKEKGPMKNDTRKLLEDFYRPFNEDLAHLLNDTGYLWKG